MIEIVIEGARFNVGFNDWAWLAVVTDFISYESICDKVDSGCKLDVFVWLFEFVGLFGNFEFVELVHYSVVRFVAACCTVTVLKSVPNRWDSKMPYFPINLNYIL